MAVYVSPVLNTTAKQITALEDMDVLLSHIRDALKSGLGPYVGIQFQSADIVAGILTVTLSNPISPDQIGRYHVTQTA